MFFVVKKRTVISVLMFLIFLFCASSVLKNRSAVVSNTLSKTVVIDCGHGGVDGGCVGNDGILEKDLNLKIGKKLEKIFSDNGYNVVMTRNSDISLGENDNKKIRSIKTADLKKRAEIANSSDAAVFISIHMNQYETSDISGAQVFYNKNDEKGKVYSQSIMNYLKKIDPENKRKEKELPNKNLVFSKLNIPGVLVECGFLSNPDECKRLQEDLYQTDIANAIYNGITAIK